MGDALWWGFFIAFVGIAFVGNKFSKDEKASEAIDSIAAVIGIAVLVFAFVRAINNGFDFWDFLTFAIVIGSLIYVFYKVKKE